MAMRSRAVKSLCCSKTGSRASMKHQESCKRWILDPESLSFIVWNRVFLVSCYIALIIDPMIFYWPMIKVIAADGSSCIDLDRRLSVSITLMSSVTNLFYLLNMVVKFHTAYTAPNSRVFAKGELVVNRKLIGRRYIKSDFSADLAASLPLTQAVTWLLIPEARNSSNVMVTLIILVQYSLRLYLTYTLTDQIIEATGVITKSAWGGAVYNLLLYLLASHIIGAIWYLFTIARQMTCWKEECLMEGTNSSRNGTTCEFRFLDCDFSGLTERQVWANGTRVFANCDAKNSSIAFHYGIFLNSLSFGVPSVNLGDKYCYGLWWGFQQLISNGQNMVNSTFFGETLFSIGIAMVSLILFAQLIGNMQTYLQSIIARVEKWRLRQGDTEEWMRHRQLPPHFRRRVRQFYRSQWLATRGVDEESILRGLPSDLRRDIKHHLCIDLVRRVSFFSEMDDALLDAICERLVSFQSAAGTVRVRAGDPVTEMLFVIRGKLRSSAAGGRGGRSGHHGSTILGPGDFCGEELLPWALHPAPSQSPCRLPVSARTVTVAVQAEGFALRAEDLRFVASQFRRMHSQRLQHALRYYSHQWRAWAACLVQAAWRRYRRRKAARESGQWESFVSRSDEVEGGNGGCCRHQEDGFGGSGDLRCDSRTSSRGKFRRVETMAMAKPEKPHEPDFSIFLHG
ncbi:cyclic nucleotide-gated ion channel 17-like [Zingiber officinale]|uniref:cyclic nucleotide-gated ion channel 17-like n=1 Tax=Zingiber officinale TaxID=94328 RepID=UPI001C4BC3C8|nr:cyclic nucleotide-gated ion channel 17-like [Zingiber officinale]